MTLAEVLPAARRLSATEKLKLIRILAEDLDMVEDKIGRASCRERVFLRV